MSESDDLAEGFIGYWLDGRWYPAGGTVTEKQPEPKPQKCRCIHFEADHDANKDGWVCHCSGCSDCQPEKTRSCVTPKENGMRICCVVGCGGQDIVDPSGGTWPTCNAYRPLCETHCAVAGTVKERAKAAANRAKNSTEPFRLLDPTGERDGEPLS